MGKNTDKKAGKSRVIYEVLEEVVRMKIQEFIQAKGRPPEWFYTLIEKISA